MISLAVVSPTSAFTNSENCIALNANGSVTLFNSCSERVVRMSKRMCARPGPSRGRVSKAQAQAKEESSVP
jgi:hypothetical protein